jgi:chemotaxis protein methyltransferase CheR
VNDVSRADAFGDFEVDLLLEAIYARWQHDFRQYARASLRRRIDQAMSELGCTSISMLQHRVLHEDGVIDRLLPFLTVGVSELFRDPLFYRALRRTVVPVLATYPSLKVWVAGCATGEEVYSLAIVFAEEKLLDRTILYATDIDGHALRVAESGVYPVERAAQMSQAYQQAGGTASLADYYTAAYGKIGFDRRLRKNVVFSDHSLATDHVFAEVQLVTCRNVLIYFDRALQDRAVGLFAEALVRNGFLGLGSGESLMFTPQQDAFRELDRQWRIYQKTPAPPLQKTPAAPLQKSSSEERRS